MKLNTFMRSSIIIIYLHYFSIIHNTIFIYLHALNNTILNILFMCTRKCFTYSRTASSAFAAQIRYFIFICDMSVIYIKHFSNISLILLFENLSCFIAHILRNNVI